VAQLLQRQVEKWDEWLWCCCSIYS